MQVSDRDGVGKRRARGSKAYKRVELHGLVWNRGPDIIFLRVCIETMRFLAIVSSPLVTMGDCEIP